MSGIARLTIWVYHDTLPYHTTDRQVHKQYIRALLATFLAHLSL